MYKTAKTLWRMNGVMFVLAKHKALFFLNYMPWYARVLGGSYALFYCWKKTKKNKGERLVGALYDLGPIYIKLGQALAVRSDIVGEKVAAELTQLQDSLPAFSFSQVEAIIEKDFGQPIEALYAQFTPEPVAAASVSQVHFAVDKAGNEVAVKVVRPKVEQRFARDVDMFYVVAKILDGYEQLKRLRLIQVVDNFAHTVRFEVDLRLEAAAASELAENTKGDGGFRMPTLDWDLTSRNVLTMERMYGTRIDDLDALREKGINPDDVLEKATRLFFNQVYRDGFFHADMHPGNLMVADNGDVIALDFGIMGRVDLQNRIFLAEILVGFLKRDYKKVSDIHFDAGYVPPGQSREDFAQACRSIGEPILGKAQKDISFAKLLGQLLLVSKEFQMETQPQLILLQKTMIYAEGLARKLNDEVNFWEISRPLVEDWGRQHLGKCADVKYVGGELRRVANRVNNVMQTAEYIQEIVTQDGLKLHPSTIEQYRAKQNAPLKWMCVGAALVLVPLGVYSML